MLRCIQSIQRSRRREKIVERGRGSVKCCTLFSIPIETQTLTMQTASRLRQMEGLHWTAFLFSWLVVTFWASTLACQCESVRVKRLVRTNCSVSFTHHWAAVYYSQEQEFDPSIYLSGSHDTWFCPLLSLKNTQLWVNSNQPGSAVLSAALRPDGAQSRTTACILLFWQWLSRRALIAPEQNNQQKSFWNPLLLLECKKDGCSAAAKCSRFEWKSRKFNLYSKGQLDREEKGRMTLNHRNSEHA